jgi:hypothetical protein
MRHKYRTSTINSIHNIVGKNVRIAFKQVHKHYHDQVILESWTIPKVIIGLESAEASKFQYIIGWTIYKLTKSDTSTMAHKDFAQIFQGLISSDSCIIWSRSFFSCSKTHQVRTKHSNLYRQQSCKQPTSKEAAPQTFTSSI